MGLELPPHALLTADRGTSFARMLWVGGSLQGVANQLLTLARSAVNADMWEANETRPEPQSYNLPLHTAPFICNRWKKQTEKASPLM